MQLNVISITLVTLQVGGDTLYLSTELPEGVWPFKSKAQLKLDIARGKAEQYVAENFPGVPFTIIVG